MEHHQHQAVYPPVGDGASHIASLEEYKRMYAESLDDPDAFWDKQATALLHWEKRWPENKPICRLDDREVSGPLAQRPGRARHAPTIPGQRFSTRVKLSSHLDGGLFHAARARAA
jgi:hypothetical protein